MKKDHLIRIKEKHLEEIEDFFKYKEKEFLDEKDKELHQKLKDNAFRVIKEGGVGEFYNLDWSVPPLFRCYIINHEGIKEKLFFRYNSVTDQIKQVSYSKTLEYKCKKTMGQVHEVKLESQELKI